MYSDTIADMLTRIRNANLAFKDEVDVPASNLKKAILDILKKEGFIKDYRYIEDGKQGILKIYMKYHGKKRSKLRTINSIVRVSHAGRRVYVSKDKIPTVNSGLGIAILTTSNPEKPVVTDKEARALGIGGELIAYVW
ncbi:30S ribosomal protein S8 [Mesoaciditoga lauensis]|uniref:30S ribosomal protein S8 n=1 Tax=Mesoaciditoga lauensis TaxID=1495039 RepID=UPI00056BA50C|nr:30S ribosomal protein S8 [Mesoaciditoga lauensis]